MQPIQTYMTLFGFTLLAGMVEPGLIGPLLVGLALFWAVDAFARPWWKTRHERRQTEEMNRRREAIPSRLVFDISRKIEHTEQQREIFRRRIAPVLQAHQKTLTRKWRQLVYDDEYGEPVFDAWDREMDYFITNVVAPQLETELSPVDHATVRVLISKAISNHLRSKQPLASFNDAMSGEDYERFCAQLLRDLGWRCTMTPPSGDQGVDIIVTSKDGRRIAVQCKKLSSPVGNAAVQEVSAGREYHEASAAVVVSNASFTPAARQLAQQCGVLLLHHEELPELSTRLPP